MLTLARNSRIGTRRLGRLAVAIGASLALATGDLAAQKPDLDKETKVKSWGYSLRPIKEWNSIPADQEERFTVGRWKPDVSKAEKRGDWDAWQGGHYCEVQVVRIQVQAETPSGSGDKPSAEEEEKRRKEAEDQARRVGITGNLQKRFDPKSVADWIEGRYEDAPKRWLRTPLKGSKMPGELIEFGSGSQAIAIGYFRKFGVEWAVVYSAFEEEYKKTWRDVYVKSICSFNVTENIDPNVAAAAKRDITKLEGDAKREAIKASIAGNPGWYAIDSKYYVILSNSQNKGFIQQLSKDLELVREKVYSKDFPPRNTSTPLSPVRVLDTQAEYHQYGGPPGSAGYFDPSSGELVLFTKFEDVSKSNSLEYCRSVAFHEAFHQYIHYAVGDVSPHSWFNEGHGDYYAGITIAGGQIRFKTFDWRVGLLKEHMRDGKDLVPTRSLSRYAQREYYSNAGLKYAQGWALIYYLRQVASDKKQKQILDAYYKHVADNVTAFKTTRKEGEKEPPPPIPGLRMVSFADMKAVEKILSEAVDKAFDGIDQEALDKDLRDWIEKL